MADTTIRINIDSRLFRLQDELAKQFRTITDDEILNLADELQRNSPVGATGDLKRGWDVIVSKRRVNSLQIRGSVVNRADNAIFRVVGRGPGKQPPIEPIGRWVQVVLGVQGNQARGVAFVIARKIAQQGTDRWKTQENILGKNRDGTYQQNSPINRAKRRIIERLNQLKI